ncbi:MAG TPA: cell division protein FtsB [Rudaea sp.]|nr:cell division protein FtsB [Rudaea sp.]
MLRYVALILLALLIALEVKLWAGEGGMREVWLLQRKLDEQKVDNQKLKQRNEALAAEVQDLKSGKAAIEERARSEQGLIKPGEVFYQVVEPGPGDKKADNGDK